MSQSIMFILFLDQETMLDDVVASSWSIENHQSVLCVISGALEDGVLFFRGHLAMCTLSTKWMSASCKVLWRHAPLCHYLY